MGFAVVAVNLLELAVAPGLNAVAAAGGMAAFTGWRREIAGVLLGERPEDPVLPGYRQGDGWRARRLPLITSESAGRILVRSHIDGSSHDLEETSLVARGAELGAPPPAISTAIGGSLQWWRSRDQPPGPRGWVVSSVPADAARDGFYWRNGDWVAISATQDSAAAGPLVPGCACRTCAVAGIGYLAHLWSQREITASHLLGWHNLHQVRLLIEDG